MVTVITGQVSRFLLDNECQSIIQTSTAFPVELLKLVAQYLEQPIPVFRPGQTIQLVSFPKDMIGQAATVQRFAENVMHGLSGAYEDAKRCQD